jgi:hypothetical protein
MVLSAFPLFSSAPPRRPDTSALLILGPAYQPSRPCLSIVDGAVQSFTSTLDENGKMDHGLNVQSSLLLGQLGLPGGRTASDAERLLSSTVEEIVAETPSPQCPPPLLGLGCEPADQEETLLRRAFQRAQADGCPRLAKIDSHSSGSTGRGSADGGGGCGGTTTGWVVSAAADDGSLGPPPGYRCSVYLVKVTRPNGVVGGGIFRRKRSATSA